MVSTSALAARLAKIESQRNATDGLMCVLVRGGFRDRDDDHDARAGGQRYDKFDDEPFGDFVSRAKAEARAAGERLLVVRAEDAI